MLFKLYVKRNFLFFCTLLLMACREEPAQFASGLELFENERFFLTKSENERELNIEDFKAAWRDVIFEETLIEPDFHEFHIAKENDKGINSYWLCAKAKNKCIVVATRVFREENRFVVTYPLAAHTCGCVGCKGECVLEFIRDECICKNSTVTESNCHGIGKAKGGS